MRQNAKLSLTFKYVLVFGLTLLLTTGILGFVLLSRSHTSMKKLTDRNMLNIVSLAADMMDGDTIPLLTAENRESNEKYIEMYGILTKFQNDVEIEYIYVVKPVSENEFIYVIDPDPEEPAEFGETIVLSEALISAGNGKAAVDSVAVADEWGCFYSAYCPVFDSDGKVSAIVGIDFNNAWYESQISENMWFFIMITLITIVAGGIFVAFMTRRTHIRMLELNKELNALSDNINELTETINSNRGYKQNFGEEICPEETDIESGDEISVMDSKICEMNTNMQSYLAYLHDQAYTDALTGVGNTTAYTERLKTVNDRITSAKGTVAVALFDINGLKWINDHYSHTCGDLIIKAAANSILSVFGAGNTFRIGGDEFIAVVQDADPEEFAANVEKVINEVDRYNQSDREYEVDLSMSRGIAVYDPEKDENYSALFLRADEAMYADKEDYYKKHGERRRH